jgi:hypothetical protein
MVEISREDFLIVLMVRVIHEHGEVPLLLDLLDQVLKEIHVEHVV